MTDTTERALLETFTADELAAMSEAERALLETFARLPLAAPRPRWKRAIAWLARRLESIVR
jgi:hypothetical protein